MDHSSGIGSQLAPAPAGAPTVRPDLEPLYHRADLTQARTELSIFSYATAPGGSARRELFDRVSEGGEDVDRVLQELGTSRGLVVPGEDKAILKEYLQKRQLLAPQPIPLQDSPLNQVPRPSMDRAPGFFASPEASTRAVQSQFTKVQMEAIEGYKAQLNADLAKSAQALAVLEENPAPGVPEYEQAHQAALAAHHRLLDAAQPDTLAVGVAQARENAVSKLSAIASDPALGSRVTPQLKEHYESVSRGGAPVVNPRGDMGTGMPRPALSGRFAGMENPQDLPLKRDIAIQIALLAENGPNADRLVNELRMPPTPQPDLDHAALTAMYLERKAALDQHRNSIQRAIQEAPSGPTRQEREAVPPADLSQPPFRGDGPAVPPAGVPGGPNGPGQIVGQGPETPGMASGGRFRPAVLSPETHASQKLLDEIRAVEDAARKRIRQETLFTALSAAGAIATAAVAIASEVATAPMNPHADPGKALGHAATAMNTVGLSVGQHLRQKVHERTKADQDIKGVIDTHTREQRAHAEEWAEKMSNQMDHLDNLHPPVAELDRLELLVADSLHAHHGFRSEYESIRDQNAYDIHLAAANEMIMSSNKDLQETGLLVANTLRGDQALAGADWKTLQNHIAELGKQNHLEALDNSGHGGKGQVGTYESYLREVEHQGYVAALEDRTHQTVKAALDRGELGTLMGDNQRAEALLNAAEKGRGPNDDRPASQLLLAAIEKKHYVERSVQAAWRDFAARAPIHADRVAHGGMDAGTLLGHLYGRTSPDMKTPDRSAAEGLRLYFQRESAYQVGQGNKAERMEALGIPRGWGDHTVAGSKVGVAVSQNGGAQALLLGFKADSNQIDSAAVHLFAREGISTPPASDLVALGIAGQKATDFRNTRVLAPPPHMHVTVDGDDIRNLSTDGLSSAVAQKYNAGLKAAYQEHAERQLDEDAKAYASIKILGRGLGQGESFPNPSQAKALTDEYKDHFRETYRRRGEALATREAIPAAGSRALAAQLKEAQTMGGFSQVVESNRGHFNYPPHRAALDRNPRNAMEGASGDRPGRDLQRVLAQADNAYLSIPDEIKKVRDGKRIDVARDPQLLYKLSERTAQLAALMDTPIRQSQMAGLAGGDRGGYEAALRFLQREGYAQNTPF